MQRMKCYFISALIWMCLSTLCYAATSHSNASDVLQSRLQQLNGFYAKFTQQVISPEGDILQQGSGEVWAQRPNLFDWKMQQPQQSQLVSDGKTVWMYEPDLAQVTCFDLKHFTQNALFLLILNNDAQAWQKFTIQQQGDVFTLIPIDSESIKEYQITLTAKGQLLSFSMIEQDGQQNSYQFTAQRGLQSSKTGFSFKIPAGVTIDDQR